MQIAKNGIKLNDTANAPGICISVYVQYCPHHCKNCFNPETWSKDGGDVWDNDALISYINSKIHENGIVRSLALLGGEPLCPENVEDELTLVQGVKTKYPETKIYIWTGYLFEQLIERAKSEPALLKLLYLTECIIDGPYIDELRDITLKMRGSSNQRIIEREAIQQALFRGERSSLIGSAEDNGIVWENIKTGETTLEGY